MLAEAVREATRFKLKAKQDADVEAFVDRGRHARSAVGIAMMAWGIAVEVEAIVEVER